MDFEGEDQVSAVRLKDGERRGGDLVLLAVYLRPVTAIEELSPEEDGGLLSGPDLAVEGLDGVWAAGDVARVPTPRGGGRVRIGHWRAARARIAAQSGRRRRAGMSSAIRREVPIRTFNDWNDPEPEFVEADFVAHGGTSVAGSFVQTLVLTDIATGWTKCVPVVTRNAALVIAAIRSAMMLFPFPLKGIDFDNDSTFMNAEVVPWYRDAGLVVTRSRAYKKNDQAWVEQKNGAVVRRLVGYGRLEGVGALRCLNRLYAASRLQVNLCHPSFKLKSKHRVGAKAHKTWDKPRTPAERLLSRNNLIQRCGTP